MRILERFEVRLQRIEHRVGLADVPVLALVVERLVFRPDPQDDLQRFARHVAVLAGEAVDVEHRPITWQAARGDAEQQPPLRQVVEEGDAVRQFAGMMVRQQEPARPEPYVVGLHQCLRHQQVGRGVRFPRRRVVFADPGFAEAQLVRPLDHFQVPLMPVVQGPFWRVRRHREEAVVHDVTPYDDFCRLLGRSPRDLTAVTIARLPPLGRGATGDKASVGENGTAWQGDRLPSRTASA